MTVSTEIAPQTVLTLTDSAVRRIKRVLSREGTDAMLRVSVEGGGCSGFQYLFDIVRERNDDDIAIEKDGAVVLVDSVSVPYMEGSVLDFVDDLIGQSFKIENPHASASCGCGTSFSI